MSDELESLATEWRRQVPTHEEILRTLGRALRAQQRRRLGVLGVFLAAWLFLVTLVLIGYEGMSALTYGFRIACAALLPLWLMPLLRYSWHGQPLGSPAGELLETELGAQLALARVLALPMPQVALSVYAAFVIHIAVVRSVIFSGMWLYSTVVGVQWLIFALGGWLITWHWLGRTMATIRMLAVSLGRDPAAVAPRHAATITGISAVLSMLLIVFAGAWSLTYIGPFREWEAHLAARDRGRSTAAVILAHRIERMDERFAADAVARSTSTEQLRRDAVVRLRGILAKPGSQYLLAVRRARAGASGPSIDVEQERVDWLDAAEAALAAERMGPTELSALLRAETPSSPCLLAPASARLQWLASQPATTDSAASDLDCLLATLEDATSPLMWGEETGAPSSR